MSTDPTATTIRTAGYPGRRAIVAAPGPLMRLWHKAVDAVERRRALDHVARMDDRMLRDIGVHRGNVEDAVRQGREADKRVLPWWDR
ncbi:DUF1127 domain-containing protein [Roseomonas sp. HJA6]|uniref:DUF1127 domain-containing protein n=1 Tax=Roseomonas alba TaxID=2846776 RepID=A0ABS7AHJ7_9PROT|nr:DUF1127 domain-containing protein [Neoroseomonas alba]MBW6401789.1 DUF1127 domain-containing protein [Neoroseomonas alba]